MVIFEMLKSCNAGVLSQIISCESTDECVKQDSDIEVCIVAKHKLCTCGDKGTVGFEKICVSDDNGYLLIEKCKQGMSSLDLCLCGTKGQLA